MSAGKVDVVAIKARLFYAGGRERGLTIDALCDEVERLRKALGDCVLAAKAGDRLDILRIVRAALDGEEP